MRTFSLFSAAACFQKLTYLSAFTALPVNNDTGACAVGAEDAVVQVQFIPLYRILFGWLLHGSPAHHTVAALQRDDGPAIRTCLPVNSLMVMRTFQNLIPFRAFQLFLDVTV